MSILGAFSRKSKAVTNVQHTETNIHDDRIGAADGSLVADDGATVHIERMEADVMEDTLSQLFGFARQETERQERVMSAGLGMIASANEETSTLAQQVLEASRSEAGQGMRDLMRVVVLLGIAAAAAYAIRGR